MLASLLAATVIAPPKTHVCVNRLFLPAYHAEVQDPTPEDAPDSMPVDSIPAETNLRNVRQLTFGGQNAEAYWSVDGRWITYQSLQPGFVDEQIIRMRADGYDKRIVSTQKGRCTCSYFTPDGKWIYFSSTHERNEGPQKKLDMSKGYLWMVNPDFALYKVPANAQNGGKLWNAEKQEWVSAIQPVMKKNGYIAETTIAPNGRYMTFTGSFDGDLEIYRANLDGSNVVKLTDEIGYDGGPFVSWDSKKIVYRRDAIDSDEELKDYKALLAENLVRPSRLEIWIMDADGKNKRQVTQLGAASFAPFLHPDGKRIIFASNYGDPRGREFDLWIINVNGTGLKRVTHSPDFDGFPMFSRDGKKLLFASNRYGKSRGETNVFVADWKD